MNVTYRLALAAITGAMQKTMTALVIIPVILIVAALVIIPAFLSLLV